MKAHKISGHTYHKKISKNLGMLIRLPLNPRTLKLESQELVISQNLFTFCNKIPPYSNIYNKMKEPNKPLNLLQSNKKILKQ